MSVVMRTKEGWGYVPLWLWLLFVAWLWHAVLG